jgi:eukaryotic-like serine/threonine-protein kinase
LSLVGETLSHYRITSALGAGGMGEVYRATDATLGREVAIKVLPAEVAHDARRLQRFEREAHLLAALNHPNIAAIYGLEVADGRPFLALELVPGEDLAARLRRGAVPVDEALEIARQIAEALEEAHERGIVHRDLKPANVKVRPDGRVKVLDFGLARAFAADPDSDAAPDLSQSPTLPQTGTLAGVLLGTAAYMAPEQARGKAVDRRADVWAFGVVLFEMLSGRRLFEGETVSDVLAGVLKTEPDFTALPAATPPAVRALLRRCLTRDPKKRLRDIGEARVALEEEAARGPALAAATPLPAPASPAGAGRTRRERAWMALLALAAAVALVLGAALVRSRGAAPPAPPAVRATIPLPPGLRLDGVGSPVLALSRDGRALAFVAREAAGVQRLYVRRLDEAEARLVPGSETAEGPFFSPDGRWVAFAVGASLQGGVPPELRKHSLDTGLTQTVCAIEDYFGGAWTDRGSILFVGAQPRGLLEVDAGGGAPRPLVETVREGGRDAPRTVAWPELLPGGRGIVIDDWEAGRPRIVAVDLASREVSDLGLAGWGPRYLASGHLVYGSADGKLMGVRFDPAGLRVTGAPVALAPEVAIARNNSPAFALAPNGTLVHAVGHLQGSRREPMRVVRARRGGPPTVVPADADLYGRGIALSPDGRALALTAADESIWLVDVARGTRSRLPRPGMSAIIGLRFTPDGRRLVLAATREGTSGFGLFTVAVDRAADAEALVPPIVGELEVAGWAGEARDLVYLARRFAGGTDLVRLPQGGEPRVVHHEQAEIASARVSPDGRHVAFDSAASGDYQVYLLPLGDAGRRVAVTSGGGRQPSWSRDGRELLFVRGREVLSVAVEATGDGLHVGPERAVVEWDAGRVYDVSADGALYGVEPVPGAAVQTSLQVRTGWLAEVERLAGRGGR